ncbi:peptidoglycan recognition family protein [Pelomonas sp. KK5]|uniref:peptidoglycan recognition protein family protein n=1 Tax=Pelomonas sp. KK5 TaxID=1855730 RepID=UPI00097C528A|nr:peptidoglycan recognition family protein [Pelomonas sp. KK5]
MKRILLTGLLLAASLHAAAIDVVPTDTWGGSPSATSYAPQTITHITLHHQGETWAPGRDVPDYLRHLQQWSRETKHWADIPYHYVIDPEGRVYAARPEAQAGDTNTEYDPRGHLLIMVLGNFEEVEPNAAQLRATVELMADMARKYRLTAADIASHKDFSTQTVCPGKNLYRYLQNGWIARAVTARLDGKAMPALP